MPPQSASQEAKRLKELVEEKATLEQTINELKEKDDVRERRHEQEREVQNKEFLKRHEENLQQLKLIAQREEALKDKEEVLNQARTELEAEYLDRRQKRLELADQVRELHAERDSLVEDIASFEEEKAAFRKMTKSCEVSKLEAARMEAEDLRQQLAKAQAALEQSQSSHAELQQRINDMETELFKAKNEVVELSKSKTTAIEELRQRMNLRDLHTSWCVAALGEEQLQLAPAQQEAMKAWSEALAANAAVPSEGRPAKKRKAAHSATLESVHKLQAELMGDGFTAQRLLELTCEALLRVHCHRASTVEDAGSSFRLEELARELHAAEKAILRAHKAKPVMPLLGSAAVVCLMASGGARRSRARLEELQKRVKSVTQEVGNLHRVLRQISPHLKNIYVSGKAEAADKWLPQMLEHLVGHDGVVPGLWGVSEESVEAWDLLESFQQRCRRFLVHSKSEQGALQLRLLLYWLFIDSRQVLDAKRAEEKQPWVELVSLLRQLAGEYDLKG